MEIPVHRRILLCRWSYLRIAVALLLAGFVQVRADEPCARCHANEVAQFQRSPMGRSVGPPSVFTEARVVHKLSESVLTVRRRGSGLEQRLEHRGVYAKYPVPYSVGAGIIGYSYFVRVGAYLFRAPLSYYTQTQSWDLAPGFETNPRPDFNHQISTGCLFCHAGSVDLVPGAPNQFREPPFTPISCERCHGSSAAHLRNPIPGSIVNPAKLLARERNSVCEQCHLEGDVRVLNPGRDWFDFHVGSPTESVFVTYLRTSGHGDLRAVSQIELMARSQCLRQSGDRLWCGSCHNPHALEANRAQAVRKVCLGCHSSLFESARHPAASECVTCHMPRLRPTNVLHAAITDHSIPRKPRSRSSDSIGSGAELKAWRDPESTLALRNLGLAYFDQGANTHAVADSRRAYQILSQLPPEQRDPLVEADLASLLLQQNQPRLAIEMFQRAVARQPSNARYAYCLGAALGQAGKSGEAVKELRRSIKLDPSQQEPYLALAEVYQKSGQEAESRRVIEEYLRFMPQNIWLRQ